jgi:hypothetical protein
MIEKFSLFLDNFPIFIEHNSKGVPDKLARYDIGLRRLRFLRRFAQPFAWGPTQRARELGEQVFAFLVPITEDTRSNDIPESVRYEYLAGCVSKDKRATLFAYMWFESLNDARQYVLNHGMTIVGGWNE